jgi:TPR repeat protein
VTKLRAPALITVLLPMLFGLLGCKAGAAGKFIEPDKPTADEAMGELICSADQKRAEPLIVDWSSDDRTDLEVAMRDGIVVASYDCNSFRVLENCRVTGGYTFAGVGRKEDVVQISGQDELHANFPLGAAKITAGLDRNSTIDVALVTVGKHRTSAFQVARTDMQGDCEGATHFISSAVVGAFAVGTGTRGHVGTVAEVFKLGDVGGSSTSEQKSLNRDGDLAACGASNPADPAPPAQCQSILRVELVALAEVPAEPPQGGGGPQEKPLETVCAEGFVFDGIKCALPEQAKSYRCKADDAAECTTQCEAGNAESCHNLAILIDRGKAGGPPDRDKATGLYQKACDGGNVASCMSVAYRLDWKAEPERVIGLVQKSCDGDDAIACRVLGNEFLRGDRLGKDTGRGEQLLTRACAMAETFACGDLAWFLWTGRKQVKQALEVVEGDCTRGNGESCSIVGGWLSKCEDGRPPGFVPADVKVCEEFPTPDAGKATLAFDRSCRSGYWGACHVAAERNQRGKGVKTDMKIVLELLELGCPKGWYSCEKLGQLYESGDGVKQDLEKALDVYGKGCDGNDKGDCFAAARVAEKLGKDDTRRIRLEQGCKKNGRQSCDAWTKLLEDEKRTDEAKAIYDDVCQRMKYKPYCDAFKRLGGTLPKDFKTFDRKQTDPDEF